MSLVFCEWYWYWLCCLILVLCLLVVLVFVQVVLLVDLGVLLFYVIGLYEVYLILQYWVVCLDNVDVLILDCVQIEVQNVWMWVQDSYIQDIVILFVQFDVVMVCVSIIVLLSWFICVFYNDKGQVIVFVLCSMIEVNFGFDVIFIQVVLVYGLVVKCVVLCIFFICECVFSIVGDIDIDCFQELVLFFGDKVVVVYCSVDGCWLFVYSECYSVWIEVDVIVGGDKVMVFGYGVKGLYWIVIGVIVQIVYILEDLCVLCLQLDMGICLLVLVDWFVVELVNGQQVYVLWVVQLLVCEVDGCLKLVLVLLLCLQDIVVDYLLLILCLLLQQVFKFLGECYGWGYDYDICDCSGFVFEIYCSFGVLLLCNISVQVVSLVLDCLLFSGKDGKVVCDWVVISLQVGDLVYIFGYVMMVIGYVDGCIWVIYDMVGGSWFGVDGMCVQVYFNGVLVMLLELMMVSDIVCYIDCIINIQCLWVKIF